MGEKNGETGWEGGGRRALGRVLLWAPTSDGRIWVLGVTLEQSGLTSQVVCRGKREFASRAAAFSNLIILGNKFCARNQPGSLQGMSPTPTLVQMIRAEGMWRVFEEFEGKSHCSTWSRRSKQTIMTCISVGLWPGQFRKEMLGDARSPVVLEIWKISSLSCF